MPSSCFVIDTDSKSCCLTNESKMGNSSHECHQEGCNNFDRTPKFPPGFDKVSTKILENKEVKRSGKHNHTSGKNSRVMSTRREI